MQLDQQALTGLPSTATMTSPRIILPAKPLPVGTRPAFATALPGGTCSGAQVMGSGVISVSVCQRSREISTNNSAYLQYKSTITDIKLIRNRIWCEFHIQASTANLK